MFTYSQLQAGIEANQLRFDVTAKYFDCTKGHFRANTILAVCQDTCPFIASDGCCSLPMPNLIKLLYLDKIRKYNPEYLL